MGISKMGNHYGSEFWLHHFLENHKADFSKKIEAQTNFKGELEWLDYPQGEYKGIEFPLLQDCADFEKIKSEWENFWPQTGEFPNWDGIFTDSDGEIVIVEAKAHTKEMESDCGAVEMSKAIIKTAFEKTKNFFGVGNSSDWTKIYYQMANRLAFVCFLNEICGIKAKLLNIYFLNGWDDSNEPEKSVKTEGDWEKAIDKEYEYLGIKNNAKIEKYVAKAFIDCNAL